MAKVILQSEQDKRIGVHYEFNTSDQPIGEGGMGKVFKGLRVDEYSGSTRSVAVKFMYTDLPESAYERARREAEIQLRNDNLIEMLGFIETEEIDLLGSVRKHYHVVSELLTGVSLADVLNGNTKNRDGEDVAFAVKMAQDYRNDPEHFAAFIVRNVLSGLLALHDAGYIHRDIDPSNIMLTEDGHIKLIDFGIAKQMNSLTTGDKGLTVAGKFMGKPEYAAPELALGDIAHQNQTTDIYAVGILLYQCIVGHTPFEGPRHEILEKQINKKMQLDVIKNRSLRNVISTACEKRQELRYQSSAQMRVALENIGGLKQAMSPKKKQMIIGICIGVVFLLMIIFVIVRKKQIEAMELAEKARTEQLIVEKRNLLEKSINEAETALQNGLDHDMENFEEKLIEAHDAFVLCKQHADSTECLASYSSMLDDKVTGIRKEMLMAIELLESQAAEFHELGESELADFYYNRAHLLKDYLSKFDK